MKQNVPIVIYRNWLATFTSLPPESVGNIIKALSVHVMTGETPMLSPDLEILKNQLISEVDESLGKYFAKCARNKQIAEEREAKKAQEEHERATNVEQTCAENENSETRTFGNSNSKTKTKTKTTSSDEEESKEVSDKPKRSPARFQPPTLEEVREYWKTQGYTSDPDGFWNFYEGIDWKVGKAKTPMKKWKNSAYGWEHREYNTGKNNTPAASTPIVKDDNPFRNMDMDDYHRRFGDL